MSFLSAFLKGSLIGSLVRFLFILSLGFTIWMFGVTFTLLFTYGVLANITAGQDIVAAIEYLTQLAPEGILAEFGKQIFTNLPFADFANAVFITHVQPDLAGLFNDVVTAALAGLLFFIITRLNLLLGTFIQNRFLFGSIVSVMTVLSICCAMICTTYLCMHFEGTTLFFLQCSVMVLSLLVHTLFLFIGLKGFRFLRILLHTVLDLLEGTVNNVFFWFCSYLFMYEVPTMGLQADVELAVSVMGAFVLWVIYSIILDAVTSFLWHVTS